MSQETFEKIIELLKENSAQFIHLTHEHVVTSEDAAKIRGTRIEQAAKAIVLKIRRKNSNEFIQCVLSGARRIDLKKLKQLLNEKNIGLATADEVLKITGCTIGSVPPFGELFGLKVFFDKQLLSEEEIVFCAGTHNDSIKIKTKDYINITKPIVEDVS
jgi:Ala-tRNA(Pro) deacylase